MATEDVACANCGARVQSEFCGECGQRRGPVQVSVADWLRDAADELFSLNSRLWRTARLLLLRPGALTLAWRQGRRAAYLPPLRLYLVTSLAVLSFIFSFEPRFGIATHPREAEVLASDPQVTQQREAMLDVRASYHRTALTRALLISLPLLALLLTVLHVRSGTYFVEHLVHSLHLHTFAFLLFGTTWALIVLHAVLLPVVLLALAIVVLYAGLSLRRVYASHPLATAARAVVIVVAYAYLANVAMMRVLVHHADVLRAAERSYDETLQRGVRNHDAHLAFRDVMTAAARGENVQDRAADVLARYQTLESGLAFESLHHARYHMAQLHLLLGNADSAAALAVRLTDYEPGALAVAARALEQLGREDAAAARYAQLMDTAMRGLVPGDSAHGIDMGAELAHARARVAALTR